MCVCVWGGVYRNESRGRGEVKQSEIPRGVEGAAYGNFPEVEKGRSFNLTCEGGFANRDPNLDFQVAHRGPNLDFQVCFHLSL